MLEADLGSELTIVLSEGSIKALASSRDLLGRAALTTGVTRAHLFAMSPDSDGMPYLHALGTWQQKNTRAFTFEKAGQKAFRGGMANSKPDNARTMKNGRHLEGDAAFSFIPYETDLESFLAQTNGQSVTFPIMVEDEWQGFIQLNDCIETSSAVRVWERAEIASIEQVARQLGERIGQYLDLAEPA
jgi:hypothetical protein